MTRTSPSQVMSPRTTSSQRLTSSFNQESRDRATVPRGHGLRRRRNRSDALLTHTEDKSITSEREGLSSGLSSSSMSQDRTEQPVVNSEKSHDRTLQPVEEGHEQIRTLLDRQREQILADFQAKIRKHDSKLIMTEDVYKN